MVKKKAKRNRKATRVAGKRKPGKADAGITGFNLQKFSNDLLTVRNAHGLTQRALASKTGVTHAAIVFIERGRSKPLVETFAKLSQYLRLNPSDYIDIPKGQIPKEVLAA
jgi:DNA-binding XRE family transcriptional regulator